LADSIGRRPVLIDRRLLRPLLRQWAGHDALGTDRPCTSCSLVLARLIDGLGVGLALTIVPLYISETAPIDGDSRVVEHAPAVQCSSPILPAWCF
jgi:hypothetical protein